MQKIPYELITRIIQKNKMIPIIMTTAIIIISTKYTNLMYIMTNKEII